MSESSENKVAIEYKSRRQTEVIEEFLAVSTSSKENQEEMGENPLSTQPCCNAALH